jgi:ABC-type bacteriocin/lantibiotic exporter with double-glycine peptidase domain
MMVILLMTWIVMQVSVWPFIAPVFNHSYLASLKTNIDGDGICRQSNEYCCGPAAAVTALRRLGLPDEEGQLAILARTSSATGTPPDMLGKALQNHYRKEGLVCEFRLFNDISELRGAGLTLAVIHLSFLVDHYVVVLKVTDESVIIADPLSGMRTLSHQEFASHWRSIGITLRRSPAVEIRPVARL